MENPDISVQLEAEIYTLPRLNCIVFVTLQQDTNHIPQIV